MASSTTSGSSNPICTSSGYVAETVGLLKEKGWTYERTAPCG